MRFSYAIRITSAASTKELRIDILLLFSVIRKWNLNGENLAHVKGKIQTDCIRGDLLQVFLSMPQFF
jgi:hypothetical protein